MFKASLDAEMYEAMKKIPGGTEAWFFAIFIDYSKKKSLNPSPASRPLNE